MITERLALAETLNRVGVRLVKARPVRRHQRGPAQRPHRQMHPQRRLPQAAALQRLNGLHKM